MTSEADAVRAHYCHVRKEDLREGSALDRNPEFASFDVVHRRDFDRLLTELARLQEALLTDPANEARRAVLTIEGLAKVWAEDDDASHQALTFLGAPRSDDDGDLSVRERIESLVPPGPPSAPNTGQVYRTHRRRIAAEAQVAALLTERDTARQERDQAVAAMREIQRKYVRTDKA